MGHNSVVSGYPKSTRILRVDGLSMGPSRFRASQRPVTLPCYSVQTLFIQTPHQGTIDTPEIQYAIRGGRVVRQ